MISNKNYSSKKGFKYSIGYEDDEKVRPSCIMHPKVSQQSILCPEWPSPLERTHLKHGIDIFLWPQRQGNLYTLYH